MHSNYIKDLLDLKYECSHCHKAFFENNNIVNKYARKTTRLTAYIVDQLCNLDSISNISKRTNVDPGYISKMFAF